MKSVCLILLVIVVVATAFQDNNSIPDDFVISTDPFLIQRSLSVYDSDCNKIASAERRLSSINNDVDVRNQNGSIISSTDYHVRLNHYMDIFEGKHKEARHRLLRVKSNFWDLLASELSLFGNSYAEIFDRDGTKIAYTKGSQFPENRFDIFSTEGEEALLYTVTTNLWNLKMNKCRKNNWFAGTFYTVKSKSDASVVIRKDLFLGMISTFIMNVEAAQERRNDSNSK
jgi:uncharacterized protein YxjI